MKKKKNFAKLDPPPAKHTGSVHVNEGRKNCRILKTYVKLKARAIQGFLERGFICIKVWGVRFTDFLIFLKYPMKMK